MSILIKGMDMPEETVETEVRFSLGLDGRLYARRVDIKDSEWYEIVEVPTPHGRLIDADDVLTQTHHSDWVNVFEQGEEYGWNKAIEYVGNFAPTIIEGDTE